MRALLGRLRRALGAAVRAFRAGWRGDAPSLPAAVPVDAVASGAGRFRVVRWTARGRWIAYQGESGSAARDVFLAARGARGNRRVAFYEGDALRSEWVRGSEASDTVTVQ